MALELLCLHEKQRRCGAWCAPQHEIDALQRLVLDAMGIIPRARHVNIPIGIPLVSVMEKTVLREPGCLDPAFRNALYIKWSSREVRDALRARNSITPDALWRFEDDMMDRQRADEALH